MTERLPRSKLSPMDARQRYAEIGCLKALEQIRRDAAALDEKAMAIGPFARLDAGMVAAEDGKTRGAITNLFGSQAAYQIATMDLALDAGTWMVPSDTPAPADFATAEAWSDALFAWLSDHGPKHGDAPRQGYAALWALWLGTVPYGLWSERVAQASMEEYESWVVQLAQVFGDALDHFGLALHTDLTPTDLACAAASLTEGAWLNQCLTSRHPGGADGTVAASLVRSGRLLWRGAVAG